MALDLRMTRLVKASPEAIAAAATCLRAGGLVAMPTETVYGLAADATSDAAVAAIYAAKERPAINPLIAHVLGIEAAREHGLFGPEAETLARAFWPGPLTLVLPVAPASRISLLARAGLDTRGAPRAVARNGAGVDRGGRRPARRAFRQSLGPGEPDNRRACRSRSRRPGRFHPRRRPMPPRPRIDDRRLSWAPAAIAASGRDHAGGDRIRASGAGRVRRARREVSRTRRGNWRHIMRRRPRFGSPRPASRRTKPCSISVARSRAEGRAPGSIFRRPETSSRRRRTSFPIFARSTPRGFHALRSHRSLPMGLGRRSTIGCAGRPRPGTLNDYVILWI